MRRFTLLAILLLTLLVPLSATTPNVLTTNQEITAYKHMPTAEEPEVLPSNPTSVTFRILNPDTSAEISSGGDRFLTSTTLTESTYSQNKTFDHAFNWDMTGNIFKQDITVEFKFGPLCTEELSPTGAMTVTDGTTVIPYTVAMTFNGTTVDGVNGAIGSNVQITKNNYGNYSSYSSNSNTYTYYFYLSDKWSYTANNAKVSMSPKTIEFDCDLYEYSYVNRKSRYGYNNSVSTKDQKSNFDSVNTWTRSGYGSVTLALNDDGETWTDTSGNQPVTYKLPSGERTYKATVVVTITVGN